ncbi:flagellar basal body L-ring protein [Helicobacter sp. 12S02232-10]|uniref:flagellar basal body L-ring protein FlgH n=1 Tax=Helicobacter sp. 12S02232-10 TaxID=1476197 RepID=UPI000BA7AE29|nr:flagellar basal body L-ring protein FlgH [Helicobacter sp. 12S02232-10]PAF47187.1 flagellar basal body L-ring protein [Helicobacter sp. 12S02232-10]
MKKRIGNHSKILFVTFVAVFVQAYEPEIDLYPPKYVEEMPSKEFIPEFSKPGSLFGQGERPLFADRRAMKPDDLITVIISESSSADYSTSKTYNTASGGNSTPPRLNYNGNNERKKQSTEFLDDQTNYSLTKPTNNTNFKGGGSQNKSENLTLNITARIIKVLENGNYFIYGNKEVLVDGEKQILKISGVIRPYDISRDNTIQSKFIADSKIEYSNIGALSNTKKKKFASDALETEWPY